MLQHNSLELQQETFELYFVLFVLPRVFFLFQHNKIKLRQVMFNLQLVFLELRFVMLEHKLTICLFQHVFSALTFVLPEVRKKKVDLGKFFFFHQSFLLAMQ